MNDVELEMLGGPKDGLRIKRDTAPIEVIFPFTSIDRQQTDNPIVRMVYTHGAQMADGHHVYRWEGYRW